MLNSNLYKQIDGCTMGGPLSVTFSDIYMTKTEEVVKPTNSSFYKRYVDDRISKKKASSYLKQTVINLYDTEFTKKRISLLNLGRNSVLTTTTMCLKSRNSSVKRKK